MTNLNTLNQQTTEQLSVFGVQIEELQRQLTEMQAQMRQMTQMSQAQQQLTKEWEKNSLANVRKHLRDSASVYQSKDAIEQMREDLNSICDEALENFEEYQQSNRYLDQFEAEEQDANEEVYGDLPLLDEADGEDAIVDDDTPLIARQVQAMISRYDQEFQYKFRQMLNISSRVKSERGIATKMSELGITANQIAEMAEMISSQSQLLAGFTDRN